MHLAEGVLPLGQAISWSILAAPLVLWSIRGEQRARQDEPLSAVVITGATSLLFAATLLPLPVPVVGATSHVCLTPVLALLVGLRRIVWPTFFVLLVQALFFAHGGITTLGVNTLTLGVLGPLVTLGTWRALRSVGANPGFGIALACGLGDLAVYVTDAAVLALALADVATPITTFTGVLLGFAPVQLPLVVLEAAVSIAIVRSLVRRRPDLLPNSLSTLRASPTGSRIAALLVLVIASACNYEGIDETVFGATAESAGQPPTQSIVDLSQGDIGLAMSILVLFGLGFVAGRSWEKIFGGGRAAPSR